MTGRRVRASALAVLTLACATVWLQAQGRPPAKATVTTVVETARVAPGGELHAALRVRLPQGFHTNSNKPRDPNLIPITVTVLPTPSLPPGTERANPVDVTIAELVFPAPIELKQRGADQPLLVFEGEFTIGAVLNVAPSAKPGEMTVPVRVRYQACDESMCYIP